MNNVVKTAFCLFFFLSSILTVSCGGKSKPLETQTPSATEVPLQIDPGETIISGRA